MEFVDNAGSLGVAYPARRLDSFTVSIELPKPLERALRSAGLVDPRNDAPSLNQWSKESGVHTSTISAFLSGRKARPGNVQRMADALEVSTEELYGMIGRDLSPWSPPSGTEKLNVRQRHALNELILAFIDEDPVGKVGDGNVDADAGSTAPMSAVDDGGGENVHYLVPPPPAETTAAYRGRNRGRNAKKRQDDDAEKPEDHE